MSEEKPSLEEEYIAQRPVYEAFTKNSSELIKKLIDSAAIEISSIDDRTKTIESFKGKLERGEKSGKYSTLGQITDLSGLRIISFLKEDCDKIAELMKENFSLDENNSLSKEDELDPDRFGYQSIHLIL